MATKLYSAMTGIPVVQPVVGRPVLFAATSSSGFGTLTGNLTSTQTGEAVRITGVITSGTVTASAARLTLPNSWTLTPNNGANPVVGRWYRDAVAGASTRKGGTIFIAGTGNGFVSFGSDDYTTANSPSGAELVGNGIVGSTEAFTVDFTIYPDQLIGQGTLAYGAGQVTGITPGLLPATSTLAKVRVTSVNGYGSTDAATRRFTSLLETVGTSITYVDSATAGGTFTIVDSGIYSMSYSDMFNAASNFGISRNASGATGITAITQLQRIGFANTTAANVCQNISVSVYLAAGDVIRAHTDTTPSGANIGFTSFTIARIS